MAMAAIRSGQPTASASAILEPQSCPATEKSSIPSPSINAIASIANTPLLAVRSASPDKKRVSPKPRRLGMMVRMPPQFSFSATPSHVEQSSGHPCSSKAALLLRGPVSRKEMERLWV